MPEKSIAPHPGPQTEFLSTTADICIFGGSAGCAKTFGLVMDHARHLHVPGYRGAIFRRVSPNIRNPGGLLDETVQMYSGDPLNGHLRDQRLEWVFPAGSKVSLLTLEYDSLLPQYLGSQFDVIGFDEITEFSEKAVLFLNSRIRSATKINGYLRGTCNPDKNSWVRTWIDWYIGPDGLPIPERSGVLRYFLVIEDKMVWGTYEELLEAHPPVPNPKVEGHKGTFPSSFTFIHASIYDNPAVLKNNPGYLTKLTSMNSVERGRFLDGNWDIEATAGSYFTREPCKVLPVLPPLTRRPVRYWDRAATLPTVANKDPDWTVGLKACLSEDLRTIIVDVKRFRGTPHMVEELILTTAQEDGPQCHIRLEEEPGASGKAEVAYLTKRLSGFSVSSEKHSKDKLTRFLPFSSQAEAGNVDVLVGDWNEAWFLELENFSGNDTKGKDDQVDTTSGAFNYLFSASSLASDDISLGETQSHRFDFNAR